MKQRNRFSLLVAAALLTAAFGSTAYGQAIRTFVSSTGLDTNACSRTAPCRNFQAAYNNTAIGGEIIALDAAGYGVLTINKAITISGTQPYIGVLTGQTGITVNANANDFVVLRGLSFSGAGNSTTTGVAVTSGKVLIEDCNFGSLTTGLSVSNSRAYVEKSTFAGNGTAIMATGTGTVFDYPPQYGTTLVTVHLSQIVNNTIAFKEVNPGYRTCPSGFTCYTGPGSCALDPNNPYSQSCYGALGNRDNIAVANTQNVEWGEFVGNGTLISGTGTGCTNYAGSTNCGNVATYQTQANVQ